MFIAVVFHPPHVSIVHIKRWLINNYITTDIQIETD
jgi:hypothetical protein